MDLRKKAAISHIKKKRTPICFACKDYRQGQDYRTLLPYLKNDPKVLVAGMSAGNGCRESEKHLLTFLFRRNSLTLLFQMPDGKAETVVGMFDQPASMLPLKRFQELFSTILTRNGAEL
jgi:hypothetical protein